MVQSRELLDTIVKENKGKDTNAVTGLDKWYKTGPFLDLVGLVFPPSCLRNHNRLWQVCPDRHSRQQAQVRIILLFMFVTDGLIAEGFGGGASLGATCRDGTFVVD